MLINLMSLTLSVGELTLSQTESTVNAHVNISPGVIVWIMSSRILRPIRKPN